MSAMLKILAFISLIQDGIFHWTARNVFKGAHNPCDMIIFLRNFRSCRGSMHAIRLQAGYILGRAAADIDQYILYYAYAESTVFQRVEKTDGPER